MSAPAFTTRRKLKEPASSSRNSVASITDRAAWNCIRSVARMQILEAIRASGPLSANELSELLENQSTGVYYHIRLLQKAGFVSSTRSGANEMFTATGQSLRLKCNMKNVKEAQRVIALVDGLLEESKSTLANNITPAVTSELLAGWQWEHLESNEVAQIRKHQQQIATILKQAKARRKQANKPQQMRANWHVVSLLAPISDKRFPVSEIDCGDAVS